MTKALIQAIFTFFRVLLLPMWILLLTIEMGVVFLNLFLFDYNNEVWTEPQDAGPPSVRKNSSLKLSAAWKLFCLDTIKLPRLRTPSPTQVQSKTIQQSNGLSSKGVPKDKGSGASEGPDTSLAVSTDTTSQEVQEEESSIAELRAHGKLEQVTWVTSKSQASTLKKMRQAVDGSRHGGGYVPGDSLRGELWRC